MFCIWDNGILGFVLLQFGDAVKTGKQRGYGTKQQCHNVNGYLKYIDFKEILRAAFVRGKAF